MEYNVKAKRKSYEKRAQDGDKTIGGDFQLSCFQGFCGFAVPAAVL